MNVFLHLASGVALRSMRAVDGGPLGPSDADPETSRDIACDLTASDRRCTPPEPDPSDFDPPDFGGGGGGGGGAAFGSLGTLLVVVLVLLLVGMVAWMIVKLIGSRDVLGEDDDLDELDEDLGETVGERIVDEERPPDRWRRAAKEHRDASRFRDSVRCEYRALVGDLARTGAVDEIPGRTSGEERQQIAELAPAVSPTFDDAAEIFDAAWFNDDEVNAGDDDRFVAAARVVLDEVLAGSAKRRDRS